MSTTLTVKAYQVPYGFVGKIEMSEISEEDALFFKENDIMVSIEDTGPDIIAYACPASDDSEESEIIVFANDRSCKDTMAELRILAEEKFLGQEGTAV